MRKAAGPARAPCERAARTRRGARLECGISRGGSPTLALEFLKVYAAAAADPLPV